ncbi:BrnT family toxin [Salinarimonas ramus]|uniref:BrnT family toxin n=1 Tax=Salinarimonas ramus TaxID=690164 RepID=A0A917QGW2_9HYPH|nr:BrnT family toxin [Salinarimonas ramus]GGK49828.1 hypothetical protein GCM10011322_41040 [Salinarimonas ramus]
MDTGTDRPYHGLVDAPNDFEWDDAKASANEAKHGISFETAASVFDDLDRVVFEDGRRAYGEMRFAAIGVTAKGVLFVAFTMRGEAVRIISARPANRKERRRYSDAGGKADGNRT